jgi:hypothetical protein
MIIDATQDIMTILDGAYFVVVLKKFKKPINKKGTYWLEAILNYGNSIVVNMVNILYKIFLYLNCYFNFHIDLCDHGDVHRL